MNQLPPVVRNLLILNIGVFMCQSLLRLNLAEIFALKYAFSPQSPLLYRPYTLVTYMFLHADIGHLFSNMFGLYMFGSLLEKVWGAKRFTAYYFITGIGAGLLYCVWNYYEIHPVQEAATAYLQKPNYLAFNDFVLRFDKNFFANNYDFLKQFEKNPDNTKMIAETVDYVQSLRNAVTNSTMVGASGAIFGLTTAFGMLFPNTELMLLFFPVPIKAKYFVVLYGIYELYAGVARSQGDNVAHFAHLGGMVVGFILIKLWGNQRNNFY